jgi:hypothetical protein
MFSDPRVPMLVTLPKLAGEVDGVMDALPHDR